MWYKANHHLYGSSNKFDSWMRLCEETVEIAEQEATLRLSVSVEDLATQIADEMICTVEEYEPQTEDL